jgi:hypothetical protein
MTRPTCQGVRDASTIDDRAEQGHCSGVIDVSKPEPQRQWKPYCAITDAERAAGMRSPLYTVIEYVRNLF